MTSDTDPLNVIRMRLADVTGLSRVDGSPPSSLPPWPGALIGWPPQPVVWQICEALAKRAGRGGGVEPNRPFCTSAQNHMKRPQSLE